MGRDKRIDVIRGYAMVVIAITHFNVLFASLGMQGRQIPLPGDFSFTSAAEIFFILSGYMVGMVYVARGDVFAKSVQRAFEIYRVNIAAFVGAILLAWFGGTELAQTTDADYTLAQPLRGVVEFIVMRQHPYLLGVLQIYVLLMLVTPVVAYLIRRSDLLVAGLSIGLYLSIQLFPAFNLYGGGPHDVPRQWNFNPFAWQLLYFGGMVLGQRRTHVHVFDWIAGGYWRQVSLIALPLLCVALHRLDVWDIIDIPATDKTSLGPVRILNSLVLLGGLSALIILSERYLETWPLRLVALLGRQTLYAYAASIVLTYGLGLIWLRLGKHDLLYFPLAAALMLLLIAVSYWRERLGARLPAKLPVKSPAHPQSARRPVS